MTFVHVVQLGETCKISTCLRPTGGVSFSLLHSLFERWIIESNKQINIAVINFKFLFLYSLELADDCKKSHDTNSSWQQSDAGRSSQTFDRQ